MRLKKDVLDQLERYESYIKRMKRADPEAYKQYQRIGAYILPADSTTQGAYLEPHIVAALPSFGAVGLGLPEECDPDEKDRTENTVPPRFVYFQKMTRAGYGVERPNSGVTYRMVYYFDDLNDRWLGKRQSGVCYDVFLNVTPDGHVRALRVLKQEKQTIRHRGGGATTITHQRWGIPYAYDRRGKLTESEHLSMLFCMVFNFWHEAAFVSMIRVTATKNRVTMPFVVDVQDTPQFFSDREAVLTSDGKKRRIFHVVKTHTRGPDNRGVKLHFRGLREFTWNGYAIKISVPGRDHIDIGECPLGVSIFGVNEKVDPEKFTEWEKATEILADAIGAPEAGTKEAEEAA